MSASPAPPKSKSEVNRTPETSQPTVKVHTSDTPLLPLLVDPEPASSSHSGSNSGTNSNETSDAVPSKSESKSPTTFVKNDVDHRPSLTSTRSEPSHTSTTQRRDRESKLLNIMTSPGTSGRDPVVSRAPVLDATDPPPIFNSGAKSVETPNASPPTRTSIKDDVDLSAIVTMVDEPSGKITKKALNKKSELSTALKSREISGSDPLLPPAPVLDPKDRRPPSKSGANDIENPDATRSISRSKPPTTTTTGKDDVGHRRSATTTNEPSRTLTKKGDNKESKLSTPKSHKTRGSDQVLPQVSVLDAEDRPPSRLHSGSNAIENPNASPSRSKSPTAPITDAVDRRPSSLSRHKATLKSTNKKGHKKKSKSKKTKSRETSGISDPLLLPVPNVDPEDFPPLLNSKSNAIEAPNDSPSRSISKTPITSVDNDVGHTTSLMTTNESTFHSTTTELDEKSELRMQKSRVTSASVPMSPPGQVLDPDECSPFLNSGFNALEDRDAAPSKSRSKSPISSVKGDISHEPSATTTYASPRKSIKKVHEKKSKSKNRQSDDTRNNDALVPPKPVVDPADLSPLLNSASKAIEETPNASPFRSSVKSPTSSVKETVDCRSNLKSTNGSIRKSTKTGLDKKSNTAVKSCETGDSDSSEPVVDQHENPLSTNTSSQNSGFNLNEVLDVSPSRSRSKSHTKSVKDGVDLSASLTSTGVSTRRSTRKATKKGLVKKSKSILLNSCSDPSLPQGPVVDPDYRPASPTNGQISGSNWNEYDDASISTGRSKSSTPSVNSAVGHRPSVTSTNEYIRSSTKKKGRDKKSRTLESRKTMDSDHERPEVPALHPHAPRESHTRRQKQGPRSSKRRSKSLTRATTNRTEGHGGREFKLASTSAAGDDPTLSSPWSFSTRGRARTVMAAQITAEQLRNNLNLGCNVGTKSNPMPAGELRWVWTFDSQKKAKKKDPDKYLTTLRPQRYKVQTHLIETRNEVYKVMNETLFKRFYRTYKEECTLMMRDKLSLLEIFKNWVLGNKLKKAVLLDVLDDEEMSLKFQEYGKEKCLGENYVCYKLLQNIETSEDYDFWYIAKETYEQHLTEHAPQKVQISVDLMNEIQSFIYEKQAIE